MDTIAMIDTMNTLLATAQLLGNETGIPWLSLVLWLPLLGALMLLFYPSEQHGLLKGTALCIALAELALSVVLVVGFKSEYRAFQFVDSASWIEPFGITYTIGIDGISLWLVMLTTLLTPVMILSSFRYIDKRNKEYYISLLVLETAVIGALAALDVFLFYVFWEAMLIPMFLLIGVWGGEQRIYATVKFFIFTLVGSLLMLVGILYIYFKTDLATLDGSYSFSLGAMLAVPLTQAEQYWLFWGFFLAFAIKVPLFPLHTWLPDAHTEAPTAGSVILAAVLLKLGTYGMIRYAMPFFPLAVVEFAPLIGALAVIGIVYGALVALVQKDVKRLVAYSSVSHLGFVVLGLMALTPQGVEGGIYQMLAHGVSTGGLFLCIGILYERRHTRLIKEFGGLARQIPIFATVFLIIVMSSAGLPGMNGFPGEFLVLVGTFVSGTLAHGWGRVLAIVAATGMILGAVYLLWMYQRVMFGPLSNPENQNVRDLNVREMVYLSPIVALVFVMGLFPNVFLDDIRPSSEEFFRLFNAKIARDTHLAESGAPSEVEMALDLSYYPHADQLSASVALSGARTGTAHGEDLVAVAPVEVSARVPEPVTTVGAAANLEESLSTGYLLRLTGIQQGLAAAAGAAGIGSSQEPGIPSSSTLAEVR